MMSTGAARADCQSNSWWMGCEEIAPIRPVVSAAIRVTASEGIVSLAAYDGEDRRR
jgi:hypothetical protein